MDDTRDTSAGSPPFDDEQPGAFPGDATGPEDGSGKPGLDVQGMLGQLQGMIAKIAHASEPALREVAAKAAELAAVAGEHAGPIARTIADKTGEVGHTVAERATGFASSIRSAASRDEAGDAGMRDDARDVTDVTDVTDAPHFPDAPDAFVTDPAEESTRDGA